MKFNPLKIGDLSVPLPIIQGGMGIGVSLSNLASAVTNAGGIGVISAAQIGFRDKNFENNALDCNLKALIRRGNSKEKISFFTATLFLKY